MGAELANRFPWILAQNKLTSLGPNSLIQIGYVTIPPDWTENDYHLIEHLQYADGHENSNQGDRADVIWQDKVTARLSRSQLRPGFENLIIRVVIIVKWRELQGNCVSGTVELFMRNRNSIPRLEQSEVFPEMLSCSGP